jgi:hypothetical protein
MQPPFFSVSFSFIKEGVLTEVVYFSKICYVSSIIIQLYSKWPQYYRVVITGCKGNILPVFNELSTMQFRCMEEW